MNKIRLVIFFVILPFSLMGCKESAEELMARAELTCVKIGNTRKMDSLDRTNLIVEFGVTDAEQVSLTQFLIEAGYEAGTTTVKSCAELLVSGRSLSGRGE